MIFYASAVSSYSAKVRIALCVKGVDFEERVPPNGYRSPEYRAIVPMSTLPAIALGDWVLSESEAINEFLEEAYPAPPMLPADLRQRAKARFLCRFHDLYLEPRLRELFPQVKAAARDVERVSVLRGEILRRIDQLAAWAEPSPYLMAPNIGLADCGPLVSLPLACQVLLVCGQPITLPAPLQSWLDMASQHPAVLRALAPWQRATRTWLETK